MTSHDLLLFKSISRHARGIMAGFSSYSTKYNPNRYLQQQKPFLDAIRRIVESVRIPVIANGASNEVESYADIERFRDECGATSVMIARAAQKNVSIFREEGESM